MLIWGEISPPPTHPRLGRWPNGLPRPPFGTFPAAGVNLIIFNNTHNKTKLPFSSHTRAHTRMDDTLADRVCVFAKNKERNLYLTIIIMVMAVLIKCQNVYVCTWRARGRRCGLRALLDLIHHHRTRRRRRRFLSRYLCGSVSLLVGTTPEGGSAGYNLLQSN